MSKHANRLAAPTYETKVPENGKSILLFDLDGVVFNWYGEFLKRWKEQFPRRKSVEPSELKEFYIEKQYGEDYKNDIYNIIGTKGFYESLQPNEGAVNTLRYIQDQCLDIVEPFICTAPELNYDEFLCHSEKAQCVHKHFGDFWLKRMILTKDKTLIRGHFLLDDKPVVKGAMTPVWQHLVYKQPYNAHVVKSPRVGWQDIPTLIEALRARNDDIKTEGKNDNLIITAR